MVYDFHKRMQDNISFMLNRIGNPQNNYKIIQVTGTNGKGSVSSMIYSCLLESGYKVGLYTKPSLISDLEKIRVGKEYITEEELHCSNDDIIKMYIRALEYFSEKGCEYVVIENEIGALTDYTHTLNPYMSIITNIDYDHQDVLGKTLEDITVNKCGIYKPSVVYPIIGDMPDNCMHIAEITCKSNGLSPIKAMEYDGKVYKSGFYGDFQSKNEKIACCAAHLLGIDEKYIELGLKNVRENSGLRGRWEILCDDPKIIVDVGHNLNAWKSHIKFIENEVSNGKKVGLVFSMMKDRPIYEIFSTLPKEVIIYACRVENTYLPSVEYISSIAKKVDKKCKPCYNGPYDAVQTAKADGCDTILCFGSFFLCGDLLKKWDENMKKLS